MSEQIIPSTGEYADLALSAEGVVHLAAETAARDAVLVYRGISGPVIAFCDGAYVGGLKLGLYPRLAVNPFGQIAVAYQRGACVALSLVGVRDDIRPEAEVPFGVEPCAVAWIASASFWRVAYVAQIFGVIRLVTRDYDREGRELGFTWAATDTTQGVSRILPDGSVVLTDADNIWPEYPNLSRPTRAGALVVGQGNDAPARCLGYVNGSPAYRIFDGLAFRPRAVELVPGRWVVIATGTRGIRVTDVPPFVVDEPVIEPPPPPPPPPIEPPPPPPVEPPKEQPKMKPYPDEVGEWKPKVEAVIAKTFAEAGRPVDMEPQRWGNRIQYDYLAGMSLEAAVKKHVTELRAALGLPAEGGGQDPR